MTYPKLRTFLALTLSLAMILPQLGFMPAPAAFDMKLGLLKYNGGGDWYSNPTSLPNLSRFCNEELGTNLDPDYGTVEVGSAELFNWDSRPLLYGLILLDRPILNRARRLRAFSGCTEMPNKSQRTFPTARRPCIWACVEPEDGSSSEEEQDYAYWQRNKC